MIHFTDECKFKLIGTEGKRFVGHKNRERLPLQCVKKTVKFGGWSVIVWGMISSVVVGPIVRFHGSSVYKETLTSFT